MNGSPFVQNGTRFGTQPMIDNDLNASCYKHWLDTRLSYEKWKMVTTIIFSLISLLGLLVYK